MKRTSILEDVPLTTHNSVSVWPYETTDNIQIGSISGGMVDIFRYKIRSVKNGYILMIGIEEYIYENLEDLFDFIKTEEKK